MVTAAAEADDTPPLDRRSRRRLETIEEILDIAEAMMSEEGVNALSLSEVARRLGVRPPSLYKYFASLLDVYDALFERGQRRHTDAVAAATEAAEPGLPRFLGALEESCRWALANPGLAHLMFTRAVPSFEPSPEAMAPANEVFVVFREGLASAVREGHLGPDADSAEALHIAVTMIAGIIQMTLSNEPHEPWGKGRFTPLFGKLMVLLPTLYPPPARKGRKTA